MQHIQIPEHLYEGAARRASQAGFESVDAYVADMLQYDIEVTGGKSEYDPDKLDARFTPEVIQSLDDALADGKANGFLTSEEVDAKIAETREAWLNKAR